MTVPVKASDTGSRRALKILITSGPTREPIDPVRFLSNYSTGYMGAQLVAEALKRGHQVTVVSGPATEPLPARARVVAVERAHDMEHATRRYAPKADVVIMAAAVSDYRPARPSAAKLERSGRLTLRLRATPDIIGRLPRRRGQLVAGFALETGAVPSRAATKLRRKRLDVLVAQRIGAAGGPFGRRPVQAWLLEAGRRTVPLGAVSKAAVARVLLDKIEALWYGQQRPHCLPPA